MGDPALHLGPGYVACRAIHRHRQGREVIAIFLPQPGGGILFTGVVPHVADNCVLALDIAVPFLDDGVDLRLGQRPAHRFRLRSGLGHRKSRGRFHTLCFVNLLNLFCFGEEQV